MSGHINTPTISVILPTLNAGRTLGRCLEAVREQDYPEDKVEIVIADAGSTDRTLVIAEEYGVEKVVSNPLMTGEAGKAAAIEASGGDLLALVDSDNILDDTGYFSMAARILADETISSAEPLLWTHDPADTLVNRYCALLGMNDPASYFLGNYNHFSYLSETFTGMKVDTVAETVDAVIIDVNSDAVPTFGANGFILRRSALEGIDWKPYYFDVDVFQQMVLSGRNRVGVMRTEIRHLYCDSIATFRRKQARRISDYTFHAKNKSRTYNYSDMPGRKYIIFILYTLTILPLLVQSVRGYRNKPDSAWWFHPMACWITLWEYGLGTVRSFFGASEYDRKKWKQ